MYTRTVQRFQHGAPHAGDTEPKLLLVAGGGNKADVYGTT